MRRRPRLTCTGLLLVLTLAGAACSSNGTGGGGSKAPLKIGASLPLTGDFSQPGTAAQRGYEIWKEMVNSGGGLLGRQVDLVIRDDASSQNTIVSDYNRLISQDKVDLLLGTFSSLLNLPASAVAEKNRMVYVEPAGGSPKMFNRGFKYLFFAQQATAPHQADLFVEWVKSLPADQRPKTAAYPTRDDPFAQPVVESVQKALEAAGIRTVYSKVYPEDTTNFDTIASAVKASKADLVAHGAVFEDGVGLVRSLSAKYPKNQEFVQAYKGKYGGVPPEDAADGFATAQVLEAAVRAVGKIDQTAIADWLHKNTVQTILGPLSWDATGAPQQAFILAQWQSGKAMVVLPKEVAESQTIVNPKPGWSNQ